MGSITKDIVRLFDLAKLEVVGDHVRSIDLASRVQVQQCGNGMGTDQSHRNRHTPGPELVDAQIDWFTMDLQRKGERSAKISRNEGR